MQLQSEYAKKGLRVVGITPVADSAAEEFIAAYEVTYPVLAAATQEQSDYGVRLFPAVFLIDPAGKVVSQDLDEIEELVGREL